MQEQQCRVVPGTADLAAVGTESVMISAMSGGLSISVLSRVQCADGPRRPVPRCADAAGSLTALQVKRSDGEHDATPSTRHARMNPTRRARFDPGTAGAVSSS